MIKSLITCTWNRGEQLKRGLITVLNQELLPDEIIIVDDGSTDNTKELVEQLQQKTDLIKYVYLDYLPPRNAGFAHNVGIRQAKGDLIIFTEPEVLHIGNTIKQLIDRFEENRGRIPIASMFYTMGRSITEELPEGYLNNTESILTHPYADVTWGDHPNNINAPDPDWAITGSPQQLGGRLYCCFKDDLLALRGFDERMKKYGFEDIDLFERLKLYGRSWFLDDDIKFVHQWHTKNYPWNVDEATAENAEISHKTVFAEKQYKVNLDHDDWGINFYE